MSAARVQEQLMTAHDAAELTVEQQRYVNDRLVTLGQLAFSIDRQLADLLDQITESTTELGNSVEVQITAKQNLDAAVRVISYTSQGTDRLNGALELLGKSSCRAEDAANETQQLVHDLPSLVDKLKGARTFVGVFRGRVQEASGHIGCAIVDTQTANAQVNEFAESL